MNNGRHGSKFKHLVLFNVCTQPLDFINDSKNLRIRNKETSRYSDVIVYLPDMFYEKVCSNLAFI